MSSTANELQRAYAAIYALLRSKFLSPATKQHVKNVLTQLGEEMEAEPEQQDLPAAS